MPEPAPLGPRRLWRVGDPARSSRRRSGDVVCDVGDGAIAEGLLVTTEVTLHAVGASDALDELAQVYGERVVFHRCRGSAWEAVGAVPPRRCSMRGRALSASTSTRSATLGARRGPRPPSSSRGWRAREAGDRRSRRSRARGWALVELPGFDQIRLVLPGGRRALDAPASTRSSSGCGQASRGRSTCGRARDRGAGARSCGSASASSSSGSPRPRPAASSRSAGGRRPRTSSTLRLFSDEARADSERARRQKPRTCAGYVDDRTRRRRRDAAHRPRALCAHPGAVREDLVRLEASQSWRIGHWLTRAGARS